MRLKTSSIVARTTANIVAIVREVALVVVVVAAAMALLVSCRACHATIALVSKDTKSCMDEVVLFCRA